MDGTRGITNIRYDNNNNPVRIQFDNGNVTKYIYSATGQKLRTIHYTAVDNVYVDMGLDYDDIEQEYLTVDSTDYFMDGNIIFTNGKFSKILFDEGYVNADYVRAGPYCRMRPYKHAGMSDEQFAELMKRWIASMNRKRMVLSFKFYNKDHLGNIREVVSKSDSIEQVNEYYPFGTPIYDLCNNPEFQPFKFNGKELDMMHGLNTFDYGARQYNPVLPVWDRVDPLAEDYYNVSPYVYCINNPNNAIDPDGRKVYTTNLEAQRNIINTLNQEESKYVSFGTDGLLDSDLLNKYNGISENFEALCTLANSELNYIFSVSDQDINGNVFFEKGSNQSNPNNYFYGVTNIPGAESFPSPNNNIYIYTASFLDEKTQTRNTAHEGYGHAYFYELSRSNPSINPNHTRGIVSTVTEYDTELQENVVYPIFGLTNTTLENQIRTVENQAIYNYENRFQ